MSGQHGSMFGSDRDNRQAYAEADNTGSITPVKSSGEAIAALPPEGDLAYAKLAIAEVLARGGKGLSAPWENPSTGARGTVTPIASAYSQDGSTCHDFLASYVNGSSEAWMRGEACRINKGRWEVKSLRPWKRS